MKTPGLFVSIDGPGGAGKSTVAALITRRLVQRGVQVYATTEPSRTPIGDLIRTSTASYRGMSLACLVAGDRHHHLATEIRPHRAAGEIVISDRYLPSSLVLQRIDGISWKTLWQLNIGVDTPDLAVILTAEPSVLAQRLSERGGVRSRFEHLPDGPAAEFALYADTATRLAARGWSVCLIDSTARTPASAADIVTDRILAIQVGRSTS